MSLRDGWLITADDEGNPLVFKLVNGSPYQVEVDPAGESAIVLAMEPGYYDNDLNQVPEEKATAAE